MLDYISELQEKEISNIRSTGAPFDEHYDLTDNQNLNELSQ